MFLFADERGPDEDPQFHFEVSSKLEPEKTYHQETGRRHFAET